MPRMLSAALGIWIKVGGRYESSQNKGISHYLEHLVFKGSRRYSCRQIKESIEGVGGSLNGFTSEELTCYLVKLPSRHLDLALDILSSMVADPLLSAEDIAKERTVILEEIKMHKDVPQSYVYELLDALLWPGHPLGATITGTEESVGRINRENLSAFQERYYVPANIVVSAAGLLEHDQLAAKVKKAFTRAKTKQGDKFQATKKTQLKPQLKIFHKDTEQTHFTLGFHSFKRGHPLKYALGLLHVIMGANMSSRLFNEVREKRGLAYEIGTQVRAFDDTGAFIVHAGIDNRKVIDALKLILEELEEVKDKPVSPGELKRAKEFYSGQLTLALEDTLDHMLWIGECTASLDKTYTLEEVIKEVRRVGPQDIQKTAGQIFKENSLNLALIGPIQDIQDEIYQKLRLA